MTGANVLQEVRQMQLQNCMHGGSGSTHKPIFASLASCDNPSSTVSYPPVHAYDAASTSLASPAPDGSKMFVKSIADISVISLRIKTGSQRGQKQLFLVLCLSDTIHLISQSTVLIHSANVMSGIPNVCFRAATLIW